MMAVGCIQALECNRNTCPTGVATQDPELVHGLDINDKKVRVANYHKNTIESFVELLGASGIAEPGKLNRHQINRRILMNQTLTLEEIYPSIPVGSMLGDDIPAQYKMSFASSSADRF